MQVIPARLRAAAATLALACAAALPPAQAAATTDFSDLWFNASESGWGANVIQQNNVLFVTLFVYGPNSLPTWYVASAVTQTGTVNGNPTFSGTLYRTTGPYFGGAFNPSQVAVTPVGTITFTALGSSTASLAYTVDGVQVAKTVTRQTWENENIAGTYVLASAGTWTNCGAARNGYQEGVAVYTVSQDRASIQVREEGQGYTCNYAGTYAQNGRMGTMNAGGTCSDGITQTFNASNLQVSPVGMGMLATFSQPNGCAFTGRVSGPRRGPP
jgi:hypothetical protein